MFRRTVLPENNNLRNGNNYQYSKINVFNFNLISKNMIKKKVFLILRSFNTSTFNEFKNILVSLNNYWVASFISTILSRRNYGEGNLVCS